MSKHKGETSYKETAFGIIPRSELILFEVEGIKKAWDFVLEKSGKGKLPLTPDFIKEVYKIGFGWIFPKMSGNFRTVEIIVSNYTPPKFYFVSQMMEDFMKDLQTRIGHLPKIEDKKFLNDLVSLLAWSHHKFLWIHPFKDYKWSHCEVIE